MPQIPTFVINLDGSVHRLAGMDRQLSALGVDYQRFPAVNGRDLNPETILRIAPEATWIGKRRPSPGEVGCYLSHMEVLKHIVRNKIPRACILEDDVELADDFALLLDDRLAIPADTGVLKLEIASPQSKLRAIVLDRINARSIVFIPAGGEPGSAGYITTFEGAGLLLSDLQLMIDVFDGQAFDYWRSGLVVYHVIPLPAKQTGDSEISRPRRSVKIKGRYSKWRRRYRSRAARRREFVLKHVFCLRKFGIRKLLHASPLPPY